MKIACTCEMLCSYLKGANVCYLTKVKECVLTIENVYVVI